jgi:excinuclease UvrABC ATPase subunit
MINEIKRLVSILEKEEYARRGVGIYNSKTTTEQLVEEIAKYLISKEDPKTYVYPMTNATGRTACGQCNGLGTIIITKEDLTANTITIICPTCLGKG